MKIGIVQLSHILENVNYIAFCYLQNEIIIEKKQSYFFTKTNKDLSRIEKRKFDTYDELINHLMKYLDINELNYSYVTDQRNAYLDFDDLISLNDIKNITTVSFSKETETFIDKCKRESVNKLTKGKAIPYFYQKNGNIICNEEKKQFLNWFNPKEISDISNNLCCFLLKRSVENIKQLNLKKIDYMLLEPISAMLFIDNISSDNYDFLFTIYHKLQEYNVFNLSSKIERNDSEAIGYLYSVIFSFIKDDGVKFSGLIPSLFIQKYNKICTKFINFFIYVVIPNSGLFVQKQIIDLLKFDEANHLNLKGKVFFSIERFKINHPEYSWEKEIYQH